MTGNGYAGTVLHVDLSSGKVDTAPTAQYEDFLGGKGLAVKMYWDSVSPDVSAFDERNMLVFATGPMAGLPTIAGSRWEVCGKSPLPSPQQFCYSNLGGTFGAYMKFAGYDAIAVRGRAEKPVYLWVGDGRAEVRDASALWGRGAIDTRQALKAELGKAARVVAIGPGGENLVSMASLLADNDASGSGGLGAVMGSKKLKAIVAGGPRQAVKVADKDGVAALVEHFRNTRGNRTFPDLVAGLPLSGTGAGTRKDPCYGCLGCFRRTYRSADGLEGKFMCAPAMFYLPPAQRYYGEWNDVPFQAAKLCDNYGVNTMTVEVLITWLNRCFRAGVLSDEGTGIPLSRLGSYEFIESLVRMLALRQGFGEVLAGGLFEAAERVGPAAVEQLGAYASKNGDTMAYHSPRMVVTNALLHAMDSRLPMIQLHQSTSVLHKWLEWTKGAEGSYLTPEVLHAIAERFWGSRQAADFTTYEGKALAAKRIQDRQSATESLILCDFQWPVMELERTADHAGDPTLESKLVSAVTGRQVDEEGLRRTGERVFNLHRAVLVREGHRGSEADTLPEYWYTSPLKRDLTFPESLLPDGDGQPVSRQGVVVDREGFEGMKDEYYRLRGWDVESGLQTRAGLEALGLGEVADYLEAGGLVAEPARGRTAKSSGGDE